MPRDYFESNYGLLTHLNEIVDISKKIDNIKMDWTKISDEYTPSNRTRKIYDAENQRKEFKKVMNQIMIGYSQKGWGLKNTEMSIEEYEKYKETHRKAKESFQNIIENIEMYGTEKDKEYLSSFLWASTIIKEQADKVEFYKGSYPVKLESIFSNRVVDHSLSKKETLRENMSRFDQFARDLNSTNSVFHKNSPEFDRLMRLTREFSENVRNYSDGDGQLTAEGGYRVNAFIEELHDAAEKYINAKGGPGNQSSKLGKERMNLAVQALSFVQEIDKNYLGQHNFGEHCSHIMKGAYSPEMKRLARNNSNAMSQNKFKDVVPVISDELLAETRKKMLKEKQAKEEKAKKLKEAEKTTQKQAEKQAERQKQIEEHIKVANKVVNKMHSGQIIPPMIKNIDTILEEEEINGPDEL